MTPSEVLKFPKLAIARLEVRIAEARSHIARVEKLVLTAGVSLKKAESKAQQGLPEAQAEIAAAKSQLEKAQIVRARSIAEIAKAEKECKRIRAQKDSARTNADKESARTKAQKDSERIKAEKESARIKAESEQKVIILPEFRSNQEIPKTLRRRRTFKHECDEPLLNQS